MLLDNRQTYKGWIHTRNELGGMHHLKPTNNNVP